MMNECMEEVKKIETLKERIMCCTDAATADGMSNIDTKELGESVDMLKDLTEAKKCCWEAEYFKTIVEAMNGDGEEPYGYNSNRSARTGRYIRGYMPDMPNQYPMNPDPMGFRPMPAPWGDMRPMGDSEWDNFHSMGYTGGNQNGSGSSGNGGTSSRGGGEMNPRYGMAYNEYRQARRHYHETKSPEDKREMSDKATEHLMDTIATVREMWQDADPEMKQRIKKDLDALVKELN